MTRMKAPIALRLPPPVLHRRYSIECEIGHGGGSRVFQAWDAQAARLVAMKRAHLGTRSEEMLRAEADILSSLQHPSIPTFLEYFEERGRSYLVEEWRPGTPMSRMRFFSLPKVLWIGRRLGAVLAYLHHSQLFHGDLSPGNVLLAEKGVSVIDFGLAHRSGAHPRAKGTPGYAAPEQWDEVRSNAVSDIFSLGMLLGCALTDSEPEEVNRAGSFIHLWDDPACLPAELVPLLTFLERMIAPSATRRPDLAEVQSTLFSLEQHLVPFR